MTDAAGDAGTMAGPAGAVGVAESAIAGVAPTRRWLLTAAAATAGLLVTGCQGIQALGKPAPPAPDVRALEHAIVAERGLVASYAAALRQLGASGSPGSTTTSSAGAAGGAGAAAVTAIQAVHAQHVAHLSQLTRRLRNPSGATATLHPAAVASPSVSVSAPAAGGSAGQVHTLLTALAGQEQDASARLLSDLAVLPPSLAQLFASIAASEATHVPYLRAAGRRG